MNNRSYRFKSVSIAMAVLLIMSLLAACGQSHSSNSEKPDTGATSNPGASTDGGKEDAENVELRFSWWGSQGRHDRTLQAIEKFNALHPNITVKPEYSSWDGYWEKLSTQVAASNAPDIMQMSILYIKEYSERGVLGDLTAFAGNELRTEDLNADILKNQGTVSGKLTGIPMSDNASVLLINREMFNQAGVEPPAIDSTWDELFAKSRELKGKIGDSVYGIFDASASLEAFMYYLFSKGDTLYQDNRLGYQDDHLRAWLQMWEDAREEGIAPTANMTASFLPLSNADPNKDALLKGNVAIMGPTWVAAFPAYENIMKENVDMISYPHADHAGSVLQTAMFLSASAKSKHPKEAAMFIDFMVNEEAAADSLETERGLPENKKIREYLDPKFTDRDRNMIAMLEHVADSNPSWYDPGPKGAGEVTKLFEQLVQKQQFKKTSIDEVITEFRQEADKIFEKNN
ncbi:sugar ABC transporter substrate-binding protein [Paenibacillus sp. J5C_2022]|uniref:ABC transporter substrate-binding protein n=1 Tax=Paenibacillus sp. J5C2022 TaxID=2977129 RepID=UPI0021CEB313|nr:sugar ABC transporter substrate-binding protein [Paenibacillus sp. J5C2022]MCU6711620.1 sugar ABC transporter substrate-binding protein [Paenibacillus sp. J5C2022]